MALVDTYHDKIRETVLRTMAPDSRRETHRALAHVIETSRPVNSSTRRSRTSNTTRWVRTKSNRHCRACIDLSYHYDAGGENRRHGDTRCSTAEQREVKRRWRWLRINMPLRMRHAGDTSDSIRYRLAAGNGETLMLLGRYEEATNALQGVSELVRDDEHQARIDLLQGDIAFKQGAIDRSVSFFQQGLRRLNNWVPRRGAGLAYGIVREVLIQCGHSLFPKRLHRQAYSRRRELTVRLGNLLSLNYIFQHSFKCLWAHLTSLNRAELLPPSSPLLFAFGVHACWMAMFGWQKRATAYTERTVATAREVNDLLGLGVGYCSIGIGLYASAQYGDGLGRLHEAMRLFEKAGDMWFLHLARFHKGCCHYGRGELADAIAEAHHDDRVQRAG